jgi:hypothetical protein
MESGVRNLRVAIWQNTAEEVRTGQYNGVSDRGNTILNFVNESGLDNYFDLSYEKVEKPVIVNNADVVDRNYLMTTVFKISYLAMCFENRELNSTISLNKVLELHQKNLKKAAEKFDAKFLFKPKKIDKQAKEESKVIVSKYKNNPTMMKSFCDVVTAYRMKVLYENYFNATCKDEIVKFMADTLYRTATSQGTNSIQAVWQQALGVAKKNYDNLYYDTFVALNEVATGYDITKSVIRANTSGETNKNNFLAKISNSHKQYMCNVFLNSISLYSK